MTANKRLIAPDRFRKHIPPLERNLFKDIDALRDGAKRTEFPQVYRNVGGGTVGINRIENMEQFEKATARIADALVKNPGGLKITTV